MTNCKKVKSMQGSRKPWMTYRSSMVTLKAPSNDWVTWRQRMRWLRGGRSTWRKSLRKWRRISKLKGPRQLKNWSWKGRKFSSCKDWRSVYNNTRKKPKNIPICSLRSSPCNPLWMKKRPVSVLWSWKWPPKSKAKTHSSLSETRSARARWGCPS